MDKKLAERNCSEGACDSAAATSLDQQALCLSHFFLRCYARLEAVDPRGQRSREERVDLDVKAPGGNGQRVEDEAVDGGVWTQEQVPAQDAPREEIGGAREDGTRLAHGLGYPKSRAGNPCR